MSDAQREVIWRSLRDELVRDVEERIERLLSLNHQWLVPSHHFSFASAERIGLYRDERFLSCVMVTQAVSEGIVAFVGARNSIAQQNGEKKQELAARLQHQGIVTTGFVDEFARIQRSFRIDFHHMNPPIAHLDIDSLAERNMKDLIAIQNEIFEFDLQDVMVLPKLIRYLDPGSDGTVRVRVLGY